MIILIKCEICESIYDNESNMEFDWSKTICERCSEKGFVALLEYINSKMLRFVVLTIDGQSGLYYANASGLAYFWFCTLEEAERRAHMLEKHGEFEGAKEILEALKKRLE